VRLNVAYSAFWPGFNPIKSLFTQLLEKKLNYDVCVVSSESHNIDLEFRSVFPFKSRLDKLFSYAFGQLSTQKKWDYLDKSMYGSSKSYKTRAKRVIWYSGENKRTPFQEFDAIIGFDSDDSYSNIFYFPFWMYRVDWGLETQERIKGMTPSYMVNKRDPIIRPRRSCTFTSTREPSRMRLIETVSGVMEVDKFGAAFARIVEDKHKIASAYGFQICPENDLFPGYITEKVPEAWHSGNIPIWQGLDNFRCFNSQAIVDVTGLSKSQIWSKLNSVSEEEAGWIRSQPILLKEPTLKPLAELIQNVLNS
jgi:hypothetical protein